MKEMNPHTQTPPNHIVKGSKKWLIALKISKGDEQLKIQNHSVEAAYHRVITAVKNLCTQSGMEVTIFERDYKFDKSDKLFEMHSFVTPHFYWSLSCELTHNYEIEYDFSDFPFENEITTLLKVYPLDRTAHHRPRQPSYAAFYKRVLSVQDKQFQYLLKSPIS